MMHPARRGACKGTSRGVLVFGGKQPLGCLDKTLSIIIRCDRTEIIII